MRAPSIHAAGLVMSLLLVVPAATAAAAGPPAPAPLAGATALITGELVPVADAHSTEHAAGPPGDAPRALLDVDGVALDLDAATAASLAGAAPGSLVTLEVPVPAEVVAAVAEGRAVELAPVDGAPREAVVIPGAALAAAGDTPAAAASDLSAATAAAGAVDAEPLAAAVVAVADEPVASPDVAAAVPADAHRVTVAVVGLGAAPDARYTDAEVTRLIGEASRFWGDQSGGAVSFAQSGATARYTSALTCQDAGGLWNEAAERTGFRNGADEHLLLLLPGGAGCSYGLGTVGRDRSSGGRSYVADTSWTALAHELGHNMSLWHANELTCDPVAPDVDQAADGSFGACREEQYADGFDIMSGSGWASSHLGVVGRLRLGLLEADQQRSVTAEGVTALELAPLGGTGGLRAALVTDPRNGDTYHLENRQPVGRDTWGFGGARAASPTNPSGTTFGVRLLKRGPSGSSVLLDPTPSAPGVHDADTALAAGRTFTSAGGGLTITTAPAVDGVVRARVSLAGPGREHQGDAPSPAPSTPTTVAVGPATGATTTSSPALPVTVGAAGVAASSVTGRVVVSEGTTALGSAEVVAGRASVVLPRLPAGDHVLNTAYAPPAGSPLAPSESTSTLTITRVASTTAAALSAAPVTEAGGGSVTVTVTAAGAVPGGEVTVLDAGRPIAAAALVGGRAVVALPPLTAGRHDLTARWGGDAVAAGSTSPVAVLTVTALPAARLSAPTVRTTSTRAPVLVVTGRAGTAPLSGTVTVTRDGAPLATGPMVGGRASVVLPLLPVGSHALRATVAGSSQARPTTTSVQVVIARGRPAVAVSSAPTTLVAGTTGTVDAVLTSPAGAPTGEVRLVRRGAVRAAAPLAGGAARLVVPALPVGRHTFTVVYPGDATHAPVTSAPFVVTVVPAPAR